MGGMIGVAQTSQDSTSIGMFLIADSQGITAPTSVSVERWEMNSAGWYTYAGNVTLTQGTAPISYQGQWLINYASDYLDLDSNKYRFIYKNCCWAGLNNSSNAMSSDFVISADYWHIPNNSTPFAVNPFWINMQINTPQTMKPIWGVFNCFLRDLDGDSVNLYQSDLISSYANGTFVSQVHSPINMIVNNDSIAFVSSTLGRVGTGMTIDDYRNGQLIGTQRIQWTFIVVNSTVGIEELEVNHKSKRYKVYDAAGRFLGTSTRGLPTGQVYIIRYDAGYSEKIMIQ